MFHIRYYFTIAGLREFFYWLICSRWCNKAHLSSRIHRLSYLSALIECSNSVVSWVYRTEYPSFELLPLGRLAYLEIWSTFLLHRNFVLFFHFVRHIRIVCVFLQNRQFHLSYKELLYQQCSMGVSLFLATVVYYTHIFTRRDRRDHYALPMEAYYAIQSSSLSQ